MRTRYLTLDGEPQQRIDPPARLDLTVRDAAQVPLVDLVDAQLGRGFDLRTGPLWRATLVTSAGADHLLLVALHHIASDATTARVLERDLRELCAAARRRPGARPAGADGALRRLRGLAARGTSPTTGSSGSSASGASTLAGVPELEPARWTGPGPASATRAGRTSSSRCRRSSRSS